MFLSEPREFRKRAERPTSRPAGANCPHGSACVCLRAHGTSFRPWWSYSGDAAIPEAASRWGETLAPPHDRTVSQCLWVRLTRRMPGRRGTFTGQCGQPLYPGEITSHLVGSQRGTVVPAARGRGRSSSARLRQARERGLPTRPKRDPSRVTLAWPLRQRPLPSAAGCIGSPRGASSKSFRTGTAPHG
jgi:hypothetical protein